MKIYIDFDHTLYNTNELIPNMLSSVAEYIYNNGDFDNYAANFKAMFPTLDILPIEKNVDALKKVLKDNFKRPEETYLGIKYNIFALIDSFAQLFGCDSSQIRSLIDETLANGEKYLYPDSVQFLKSLQDKGFEVYILSHEKNDLDYQNNKISGSGILRDGLVTATIVTRTSKATLNEENYNDPLLTSITYAPGKTSDQKEVDYKHGIFLDDRVKDLEALYESAYSQELPNIKKIRVFRVARPNGTYSTKAYTQDKFDKGIAKVTSLNGVLKYLDLDEKTL